jgi:hypothetical protein
MPLTTLLAGWQDTWIEVCVHRRKRTRRRAVLGAQRVERIAEVRRRDQPIEWLGIEQVIVANGQAFDVERPVELKRRICSTTAQLLRGAIPRNFSQPAWITKLPGTKGL